MQKLKNIYWRLFICRLALRWMFKFNLGDKVVFRDEIYILIQGVSSPHWKLSKPGCDGIVSAHESEFRKLKTLDNYLHSYRSGIRFYMANWYDIWIREGIKPWMLGCNIWGRQIKR